MRKNEVGLFLSAPRNSAEEYPSDRLVEGFAAVGPQLGGAAEVTRDTYGRNRIGDACFLRSALTPRKTRRARSVGSLNAWTAMSPSFAPNQVGDGRLCRNLLNRHEVSVRYRSFPTEAVMKVG